MDNKEVIRMKNKEPRKVNGYYTTQDNLIHRLLSFASSEEQKKLIFFERNDVVIYQPLYKTPKLPEGILWAMPTNTFFENIPSNIECLDMHGKGVPRFRYVGMDKNEVLYFGSISTDMYMRILTKTNFNKENPLNKRIHSLAFDNYEIRGFAMPGKTERHSLEHTLTLFHPLIIYSKKGKDNLYILPASDFFDSTGIKPNETISKYINLIEEKNQKKTG